jgi:hypothetical protein
MYPITEAGLRSWVEAALAYKSQLSTLFESPEDMRGKIYAYYAEKDGFPLWTKTSLKVS